MKSNDLLVIGSITFFVGFIITLTCVPQLNAITNNAFEGHLDMEAYNLWSTLGYIGGALTVTGAIIVAVPISLIVAAKEAK